MLYGMERTRVALILAVLICSAGCLGNPPEPPVATATATPAPPVTTMTEPARAVAGQSSDMALQPGDLPSAYTLQDRTVIALPEVSQLARQLGWQQGYYVSFSQRNGNNEVITRIWQSVNSFSSDNINGVFLIERDELRKEELSPGTRYEIPFPAIGERSIAFRETDPLDPERPVTYTVIFTKKNIYEKITMSGTSTDYELLKRLAQRAEDLVQ
jgi:hypothetical protein